MKYNMCRSIFKIILTASVCCALCACNPDDTLEEQAVVQEEEKTEQAAVQEDEKLEQLAQAFAQWEEETGQTAAQEDEKLEQLAQAFEQWEEETLQSLPENVIIDESHDAFWVETGGEMGTLLVTAELSEEAWGEVGWHDLTFYVWDPADMEQPIQTIETYVGMGVSADYHCVDDFNFDGFQDFSYLSYAGNQPNYWNHWLWDEENGQFLYYEPLGGISDPMYDAERQVVTGWCRDSAVSGRESYYRWVDGEVTLVRMIIYHSPDEYPNQIVSVYDLIDGQMAEVYQNEVDLEQLGERGERIDPRWRDLDYHGEEE